jgi:hypothetical protein
MKLFDFHAEKKAKRNCAMNTTRKGNAWENDNNGD